MLTVFYKNTAPQVAAYRKNFLRNVALHEIGHALGLDHLPNEKSIMFFQLHDPLLETLTADDLGAMQEVVAVTQKEAQRDAKYALAKPKLDVAKSNIASASERLKAEEDKIRYLVTNVDSQLQAAKDLERLRAWDHAFSIYDDAFRYKPHDETIRQNICRTANYAGRVALKKGHATQAIKYLSRGRELMNKDTPAEVRQQILETLRQSCEMNNQPKEAAEVQAILQNGNF
jgi:tetratricopeptide (TPR) repeat protein